MGLAREASALPPAFHSHQFLLAQPGRTLLPRSHRQVRAPRRLSRCSGTRAMHPELHHPTQPQAQPYIWTAKARDILEKVKRAWYALKAYGGLTNASRALESIERHLSADSEPADSPA